MWIPYLSSIRLFWWVNEIYYEWWMGFIIYVIDMPFWTITDTSLYFRGVTSYIIDFYRTGCRKCITDLTRCNWNECLLDWAVKIVEYLELYAFSRWFDLIDVCWFTLCSNLRNNVTDYKEDSKYFVLIFPEFSVFTRRLWDSCCFFRKSYD